MSYTPQPGTIAARAIDMLKKAAPGDKLSTAEILEAIGQPSTYQGLVPCMQPAIAAGLVVRERDGFIYRWRLAQPGDAPPPKRDQDDAEHDAVAVTPALTRSRTDPGKARKADHRPAAKAPRPAQAAAMQRAPGQTQEAEAAPAPALPAAEPAQQQSGFEAALSTSQRLIMFVDGQHVRLSTEYTRQLLTYLDRARGVNALA